MYTYAEKYGPIMIGVITTVLGICLICNDVLFSPEVISALASLLTTYLTVVSLFSGFIILTISFIGANSGSKSVYYLKKHNLYGKVVSYFYCAFIDLISSTGISFFLLMLLEFKLYDSYWLTRIAVVIWFWFLGHGLGSFFRSVSVYINIIKADERIS